MKSFEEFLKEHGREEMVNDPIVKMISKEIEKIQDNILKEIKEIKEIKESRNNISVEEKVVTIGTEVELVKDLKIHDGSLKKGDKFYVTYIDENCVGIRSGIGFGSFSLDEFVQFFDVYEEEVENKEEEIVVKKEEPKVADEVKKEDDKEFKLPEDVEKVYYTNTTTVVTLKSGIDGVSTCRKEDEFSKKIGFEVAYLKAKKKEIDEELKKYNII